MLLAMHLRLSEDEFATLIDMVSLAAEVASLNQKPEAETPLDNFAKLEDKILERAKGQGFKDISEIDPDTQKHRVTASYQSASYIQDCIDEMRNEIFWDELSFRLAEKDIIRKLGEPAYLSLPEKEKLELLAPKQREHWEDFAQQGLKHIHRISPPEMG